MADPTEAVLKKYAAIAAGTGDVTLDRAFVADLADLIRRLGAPRGHETNPFCPECGPLRGAGPNGSDIAVGHTRRCRLAPFLPYAE